MALSQHIKPSPYRPPSRAQIERARAMYAEGFTVSRILAGCDMSLGTLYYWLGGGPRDEKGAPLFPPIARRRVVEGKRRKPLASDRDSLVATLWRTAERTARDLGERLARPGASTPERERDVRMFGMTVRALRELSLFDAGGPAAPAADEPPADIDEFRRELARRIHALIDAEQAGQGTDQRASIGKS